MRSIPHSLIAPCVAALLASAGPTEAQTAGGPELIMFEQAGCEWCEVWNEEIAPVLSRTPEGRCARFSRFDIHRPKSDLLQRIRPIVYTPTFVIFENGREVGRVLGYAGEDFFWFQLATHLRKLKNKCDLPD